MIDYRCKVATRRWSMVVFYVRHRGTQHTCAMAIQQPKVVWKEMRSATQALSSRAGCGLSTATNWAASCIDGITVRHTVSYWYFFELHCCIATNIIHRSNRKRCWMRAVRESYGTGYNKAKDNANNAYRDVWSVALHLQETSFGKCSLQVVQ